jgi:hypothetical protein
MSTRLIEMGRPNLKEKGRVMLEAFESAARSAQKIDPADHPFWQNHLKQGLEIPDVIYVATASYRKMILLMAQLLMLNGEDLPTEYQSYFDPANPHLLQFLEELKESFYNGNGDAKSSQFLGHLFGVPVVATPGDGETHDPEATQLDEAFSKAVWVFRELLGEFPELFAQCVVVGMDTMDETTVPGHADAHQRLGKPEKQMKAFAKLHNFELNQPDDAQALFELFVEWYFDEYLPLGATNTGVTAVAMVNSNYELVSSTAIALGVEINEQNQRRAKAKADLNAAGFGAWQYLVDMDQLNIEDYIENPQIAEWFKQAIPENVLQGILLLGHALGAPLWVIMDLLDVAQPEILKADETVLTVANVA